MASAKPRSRQQPDQRRGPQLLSTRAAHAQPVDNRWAHVVLKRSAGENLPEVMSGLVIRTAPAGLAELIANGYDNDAPRIDTSYIPERDMCVVEDNGSGMTPEDLIAFYRLGDSTKLRDPVSPKGRKRLGHFGVGTVVLKQLAGSYELRTWRDGIETRVKENLDEELSISRQIPFKTFPAPGDKHGTIITLQGLRFKEGDGSFSLRTLRQRIQREFRRLTTLPDFEIYINEEQVKPSVFENATIFEIDETGNLMGHVVGRAYLTKGATEMAGVHASVNGRIYGEPPQILARIHDKNAVQKRIILDVEADGLKGAVLLDRGMFKEDNPAYVEFLSRMKGVAQEARRYAQETQVIDTIKTIRRAAPKLCGTIRSRLIKAHIDGITPKTEFIFDDGESTEGGAIPAFFDTATNTVFLYEHPGSPLEVSVSTRLPIYQEAIQNATVEAIAASKAQHVSGDPLDAFLQERSAISAKLKAADRAAMKGNVIHPRVRYSFADLGGLAGLSLGAVRYIARGGLVKPQEDTILGSDFLEVQKRTRGLVPLYDVLVTGDMNVQTDIPKLHDIFGTMGDKAAPFVRDYSADGGVPCYFVEGTCARKVCNLFKSQAFNRRSSALNPTGAFDELRANQLMPDEITRFSEGLTLDEVNTTLKYASGQKMMASARKGFYYGIFVHALQRRRGNVPAAKPLS